MIYEYDHGPYVISAHPTPAAAAKATAGTGYGRLAFVPFDMTFNDAIEAWEAR